MLIKIESIKINERMREVSEDKVTEIASSIKEIGLLNPITISDKNELIAGLHRLNAFKMLGYAEIEANVVPLSGLRQELAEIDENLIRHDLHYIDRGDHLKRRKEIYELLHPETKPTNNGGGFKGNQFKEVNEIISPTFSEDTAAKTGMSSRTIQQEVQMATNLTPEMKQQVKKADLSKTEALKLARLEPEKQKQVMEKAISGKDKIDNVIKEIKKEERQEEKRQQQLTPTKEMPKNEFEVVIVDSIGFPILTAYARMNMKQKGDALLNMIAIFGDLKEWAYRNNSIAIVINQPESDFNKAPNHLIRPFGDKSQFAAKEIWKTEITQRGSVTKTDIRAFRSRSVGHQTLIAKMEVSDNGTDIRGEK